MSGEYHFYIGPYFKCTNGRTSTKVKEYGCTNEKCPRQFKAVFSNDGKFCPRCGEALREYDVEQPCLTVDHEDIVDAFPNSEPIFCPSIPMEDDYEGEPFDVWLPNVSREGANSYGGDEEFSVSVRDIDVGQDLADFSEAFKAEHAVLMQAYKGSGPLTIEWGIVRYYL